MTDQHPITPPPELVQQWIDDLYNEPGQFVSSDDQALAARAAQWGADQELEACCEALDIVNGSKYWSQVLRSARRPKPPSLKEQALAAFYAIAIGANDTREQRQDLDTIRRALEELPD
jgi:hypothetical protein